jgi:hypothetical protein
VHPYTLRAFQWYQEWVGGLRRVPLFGRFQHNKQRKQGVCHIVTLPFTLKHILRQKEEYLKISNISPCKNIIFKKSSKRNQNPPRYYNSISQVSTQAKISCFKNPHIKIDLLLLPKGPKSLKLLHSIMNLNTIP